MKMIYILLLTTALSCSPKSSAYELYMQDYRARTLEEYKNNPNLNLSAVELQHITYFPIDSDYNIECDLVVNSSDSLVVIKTYADRESIYKEYGIALCKLGNKNFSLKLYKPNRPHIAQNYIFLPIMDATNGVTTYGGGRYIELSDTSIIGHKVNIDFNKLYNPYCAFRDGFNCPIPPTDNHLGFPLPVGEKDFPIH